MTDATVLCFAMCRSLPCRYRQGKGDVYTGDICCCRISFLARAAALTTCERASVLKPLAFGSKFTNTMFSCTLDMFKSEREKDLFHNASRAGYSHSRLQQLDNYAFRPAYLCHSLQIAVPWWKHGAYTVYALAMEAFSAWSLRDWYWVNASGLQRATSLSRL